MNINKIMLELNKIYNESNLDTMSRMPDSFVDLVVTSPPYDDLRTYNGYSFDFESIAKELFRITKEGGIVVWVVGDATINGSESMTSFKQALYFKEMGFNVHDTMIYQKANFSNPSTTRYHQIFEYMFVFVKGKIKTFNPLIDRKNITTEGSVGRNTKRQKDGSFKETKKRNNSEYGMRYNIWRMKTTGQENMGKSLPHPAMFPEQLANDHIISWSNEGDLIYDPFMGSGTTAISSIKNGRNWIGSEISAEYSDIANKRIQLVMDEMKSKPKGLF
jgi:site-specific DNA-methyltransferase (adenine-specific)